MGAFTESELRATTGRSWNRLVGLVLVALAGQACDAGGAGQQGAPVDNDVADLPVPDSAGPVQDAAAGADVAVGPGTDFNLAEMALSGSRLKVRGYKSADGAVLPMLGFWDSKLDAWCNAQPTEDGKLRCVPYSPQATYFFADANCTIVAVMTGPSPLAWGKAQFASVPDPQSTCSSPSAAYYRLGAEVPASSVYLKSQDTCNPYASSGNCYPFYLLGEQVSISEFAEMEVVELK